MNNSSDKQQPTGDTHRGYDMESGVLARVREWNDVFPWMRLARTLRVSGSPVMLGLVAITFVIWLFVHAWIISDSEGLTHAATYASGSVGVTAPAAALQRLQLYGVYLYPIAVFDSVILQSDWQTSLLAIAWALIVWMPVILFLTRQGALLTAGRNLIGAGAGLRRSLRLTPTAWLIAIVPLACVLVFGLMILFAGWIAQLVEGVSFLEAPLALMIAILAIPCGLLGFGSYIAAPLGWAALANEQDPDSLDALSRGFEYLYRRPLKVVLYAIVSSVVLTIIAALAAAIARVAAALAVGMLATSGASPDFIMLVEDVLRYYPLIVTITLFWALVGGVYLLLRHDAGEQEVEDLWEPLPKPKQPLPELPIATETNR